MITIIINNSQRNTIDSFIVLGNITIVYRKYRLWNKPTIQQKDSHSKDMLHG